jgi:hypothetical protein
VCVWNTQLTSTLFAVLSRLLQGTGYLFISDILAKLITEQIPHYTVPETCHHIDKYLK